MIKGREPFETSKKVVQATLETNVADIKRTASMVKKEPQKNRTKAMGESISKETFVNSITAQSNKTKTEFVKPLKSLCIDGSKLMSLKDKGSNINLQCEEETAHVDPRSCSIFLKYEMKYEKLMSSLKI